jgi:hypothetical protein
MPSRRERRWPSIVAGYVILSVAVAILTTIMYRFAEALYRSAILRATAGVVLGVVVLHVRALVRHSLESEPWSIFDAALAPAPRPPVVDRLFEQLRSKVKFSVRSANYFDHVLWRRLRALHRAVGGDEPLAEPPRGRWLRRGPSPAALADVIAIVERTAHGRNG